MKELKVLVVDDNPVFLQLAIEAFASEFKISTAADGGAGVKRAKEEKPDIVLMDVMMPDVSGMEMLRMLTADEETRNIPVVVLTATHFDPAMEGVFRQEGNVKGFLQKPCSMDLVREQILLHARK